MIVLDTNVVSEVMRPSPDTSVLTWMDGNRPNSLFVTSVTTAEILLGIELLPDGKRKTGLRTIHDNIMTRFFSDRILGFGFDEAVEMAKINRRAVDKGHNITFADCQIAAIAAVHGFSVATRDIGPFQAAGVPVINPWIA